jgi:hypothetical protein
LGSPLGDPFGSHLILLNAWALLPII